MAEFTKEQLIKQAKKNIEVLRGEVEKIPGASDAAVIHLKLAEITLASLEAEAVGEVVLGEYDDCGCHPDARVACIAADCQADWENFKDGTRLYTAPPAPVSVPAAMEMDDDFDSAFEHGKAVGWNAYRAAMLQGADGTLTNEGTIPVTQFKPVADLYGLTSPTGGETSFTFDAVEARDFIDGGWLCQEYVELGRYQEALTDHSEDKLAMVDHSGDSNNMVEPVTTACELPDDFDFDRFNDVVWLEAVASNPHMHSLTTSTIAMVALELNRKLADCNSPVIPDGWVACVERMPSAGEQVLAYRPDAPESNDPLIKMATYVGGSAHGHGFDCYCKPTHWMPLPAEPQQEVTQALAKGMERYGDAMRELAKKEEK